MRVAAGESWDDVVLASLAEGLAGLECLSGIPGLAGATPIQNVGAYGSEISDTSSLCTRSIATTGVGDDSVAAQCGSATARVR